MDGSPSRGKLKASLIYVREIVTVGLKLRDKNRKGILLTTSRRNDSDSAVPGRLRSHPDVPRREQEVFDEVLSQSCSDRRR